MIEAALIQDKQTYTYITSVKVYNRQPNADNIKAVLIEFEHVFKESSFTIIPEDQQMQVYFKPNQDKQMLHKYKIYLLRGLE